MLASFVKSRTSPMVHYLQKPPQEAPRVCASILGGPDKTANRNRLLEATEICGYQFKVSEPREGIVWRRAAYVQKVIKCIPRTFPGAEILVTLKKREQLPVVKTERIHKVQKDVKVPTTAVLRSFQSGITVPNRFYIGLHDYVTPPTRCYLCLSLGHIAKHCKKTQKCSYCAGDYKNTECGKSDEPKCAAYAATHSLKRVLSTCCQRQQIHSV